MCYLVCVELKTVEVSGSVVKTMRRFTSLFPPHLLSVVFGNIQINPLDLEIVQCTVMQINDLSCFVLFFKFYLCKVFLHLNWSVYRDDHSWTTNVFIKIFV